MDVLSVGLRKTSQPTPCTCVPQMIKVLVFLIKAWEVGVGVEKNVPSEFPEPLHLQTYPKLDAGMSARFCHELAHHRRRILALAIFSSPDREH